MGCPSVEVRYCNNIVIQEKQLVIGATCLQLKLNRKEAAAAGIPPCICNTEGIFQRSVMARDELGENVDFATIDRKGGSATVLYCSPPALGTKLFFNSSGKGANEKDQQDALGSLRMTIVEKTK
jgi:hypothetical protein